MKKRTDVPKIISSVQFMDIHLYLFLNVLFFISFTCNSLQKNQANISYIYIFVLLSDSKFIIIILLIFYIII
jgi:hypothetical protein